MVCVWQGGWGCVCSIYLIIKLTTILVHRDTSNYHVTNLEVKTNTSMFWALPNEHHVRGRQKGLFPLGRCRLCGHGTMSTLNHSR